MTFQGKYILAAIDGTSSSDFRRLRLNSYTANFKRDFNAEGGYKRYFDGPGELSGGVVFGRGCEATVGQVVRFVNDSVRLLRSRNEEYRICLLGHSRGGLIAINAANLIEDPVYFIALYDAVDMHLGLEGDVIHNADYVYHAMRHPSIDSRTSWGNTGLSLSGSGRYFQHYFRTSHGGLGGSVDIHPDSADDDISCSSDTLTANIALSLSNYDIAQNCVDQSHAADAWIRSGATRRELRFH